MDEKAEGRKGGMYGQITDSRNKLRKDGRMGALSRIKWINDKGEAGEGNVEQIKRGRGKQQRAKLAERDGVKMARV